MKLEDVTGPEICGICVAIRGALAAIGADVHEFALICFERRDDATDSVSVFGDCQDHSPLEMCEKAATTIRKCIARSN